jgi:hypothetical protein
MTIRSQTIVGMGLVTPFGNSPSEHAFFLRAGVPAPPASPFETRDGKRVDAAFCRWMGARVPIEERLALLGERALEASLGPFAKKAETYIFLCTSMPRPGLDPSATARLLRYASSHGEVHRFYGDAGALAALREVPYALDAGARVVAVLAVDSLITLGALADRFKNPPSHWDFDPPIPSEGAAAIAFMKPDEARRRDAPICGALLGAATLAGKAHDDNDEAIDGVALTTAMKQVPDKPRASSCFGPWKVDLLRRDDWQLAAARCSERFTQKTEFHCIESKVGRLCAASGLANAAWGVATLRHAATDNAEAAKAPCYVWAISPDGTRGVALLSGGRP